jgi:hypothetical protein
VAMEACGGAHHLGHLLRYSGYGSGSCRRNM